MKNKPMDKTEAPGRLSMRCSGIGVSTGLAVGPAFLLTTDEDRVVEREITEEEIPREIERLEEAIVATRKQLHAIQNRVNELIGQDTASIFDAHLLVVEDRAFLDEVIRGLHHEKRNVEAVLDLVAGQYANALASVDDDYLRERAADVRDVTRRLLHNLAGHGAMFLEQQWEPCIVVANDLAPSITASLDTEKVMGIATDLGSPTSHTAIMARALEIPAVVGLHDVSVRVSTGDTVLLDGDKGVLIIRPTPEEREQYGKIAEERATIRSGLAALRDQPSETKDGYHLTLSANIELPSDVDAVLAHGATGVGLFRTEYLYLSREELPTEEEQLAAYLEVASRLDPDPVIIRTLDLGGDKFVSHLKTPPELNPFMGWRAIRFCLAQPGIFKTQLRAIVRASAQRNVKVMYPMVSNADEVVRANELLEEAKEEVRKEGAAFNEQLEVGVMIEVPSAALTARLIAPHVSFFSLGTNDLVQYTFAADRVNERIAYLYEPTHPVIISLIKGTIDAGHEHGIWTGICGEMAANPLMVALLMGLGVDELSVSPNMVSLVKDVIRSVRFAQAEEVAQAALRSSSSDDVLELCRRLTAEVAPEILELVG